MNVIDNSQDTIDSRDIIARIEELSDERDSFLGDDESKLLPEWDMTPEAEELKSLLALQEECEEYDGWAYGLCFIRYDYFTEYTEELLNDTEDIPEGLPWYVSNNIDWDGVAEDMKEDYTSFDFDGIEYFFR